MEERVEKILALIALLKLAEGVELDVILALTNVVSSQAKYVTELRAEVAHERITENNIKIEQTLRTWRRAGTKTHPLTITIGGAG